MTPFMVENFKIKMFIICKGKILQYNSAAQT
jgi:hypothetical protein